MWCVIQGLGLPLRFGGSPQWVGWGSVLFYRVAVRIRTSRLVVGSAAVVGLGVAGVAVVGPAVALKRLSLLLLWRFFVCFYFPS